MGNFGVRVPQRAQNASLVPSVAPQLAQLARSAGACCPSGRVGVIAAPHRVQNLSAGSAPLPHSAQVQPVRRKRMIRELTGSCPAGGQPAAGGNPCCGCAGGGACGGSGVCGCGCGCGAGAAGTAAASARLASYRARGSGPDSRSRFTARTLSRNCCDRSGAVAASAAAWRLSRSTARSISSLAASARRFRNAYQSSCCRISLMEPYI